MSQAELAAHVGVTRQSIIAMEKGSPGLSIGTILKALEVLGLRIEVRSTDGIASDPIHGLIVENVAASSAVGPAGLDAAHSPTRSPARSTLVEPDIDRIVEDAWSGTRYPIFRQPLPDRPRKHKAGEVS